jgi:hypothetical protein
MSNEEHEHEWRDWFCEVEDCEAERPGYWVNCGDNCCSEFIPYD